MPKHSPDPLNYPTLNDDSIRETNDFYPTPDWLVKRIITYRNIQQWLGARSALDLGSGNGVWGQYLKHMIPQIDGIDIRKVENPSYTNPLNLPDRKDVGSPVYTNFYPETDFLNLETENRYDIIGFNPPFQMLTDRQTQNKFIEKLHGLLTPYGKIVFILPVSYFSGLWRWNKIFSKGLLIAFYPFSDRIDWTGMGSPRKEHGLFIWQAERITTNPEYASFVGNVLNTKE
jgi:SAM-dependent methyltransferase